MLKHQANLKTMLKHAVRGACFSWLPFLSLRFQSHAGGSYKIICVRYLTSHLIFTVYQQDIFFFGNLKHRRGETGTGEQCVTVGLKRTGDEL